MGAYSEGGGRVGGAEVGGEAEVAAVGATDVGVRVGWDGPSTPTRTPEEDGAVDMAKGCGDEEVVDRGEGERGAGPRMRRAGGMAETAG